MRPCRWDGPEQFEDPSGQLMMLPADMALVWDKGQQHERLVGLGLLIEIMSITLTQRVLVLNPRGSAWDLIHVQSVGSVTGVNFATVTTDGTSHSRKAARSAKQKCTTYRGIDRPRLASTPR